MKRLILCCDGTWNRADQARNGVPCPTNVVKIAYRIAKRDGDISQVIYYDQGVGTGNVVDRLSGGAFGDGLEDNIHDAYRFLVGNYEVGDEVYLFGFSRGAFTARSVAGMVRKCGILGRPYARHYKEAIDLYRTDADHPDDSTPTEFRTNFCLCGNDPIKIKFIGVWDTVGSLGIPLRGLRSLTRSKYQFHDTELSGTIENAYHALAIDEHRAPFEPTLWAYKPKPGQTVEQVWFCGAHSDVGGGYAEAGLSDIALEWMISKAQNVGLAFDKPAMQANPIHANPLSELHNSKTGFYRVTPGIDRPIGVTAKDPTQEESPKVVDPTQAIHESVLARWDSDGKYRPDNLKDYFKFISDRRGN